MPTDLKHDRFFKKALKSRHNRTPRIINVDKNLAYPPAIEDSKRNSTLPETTELRRVKYLNNIVEQDHRRIKRIIDPMMGFKSFSSAANTLAGIEAMNIIKK